MIRVGSVVLEKGLNQKSSAFPLKTVECDMFNTFGYHAE